MIRIGDQMKLPGIAGSFVSICSVATAALIVAVVTMVTAATAFSQGITIDIPLMATFDGARAEPGSPGVTVTGSWVGAGVSILALAVPLPLWFSVSRRRQVAAI